MASFFLVLFTMPLGHALMRVMEDTMSHHAVNVSAFIMGAVGLAIAIWGVFVKGDTKQTLFGLFGGLLFWTGWVEPLSHIPEMTAILVTFLLLGALLIFLNRRKKKAAAITPGTNIRIPSGTSGSQHRSRSSSGCA